MKDDESMVVLAVVNKDEPCSYQIKQFCKIEDEKRLAAFVRQNRKELGKSEGSLNAEENETEQKSGSVSSDVGEILKQVTVDERNFLD